MNDLKIYSEEIILHPCGDTENLPTAERFYIHDEKSGEELPFKFKTAEQAIFFILNREPRQQLRLINYLEKILEEKKLVREIIDHEILDLERLKNLLFYPEGYQNYIEED